MTIPVQTRVSIIDLANCARFFKEKNIHIRSQSHLLNMIVQSYTLSIRSALPHLIIDETEGRELLKEIGLITPSVVELPAITITMDDEVLTESGGNE